MEAATIGLDISKLFRSMQLMTKAKWPVANVSGEARSCRSSPRSHLAWSASKPGDCSPLGAGDSAVWTRCQVDSASLC